MTIQELNTIQAAMPTPELLAKARVHISHCFEIGKWGTQGKLPVSENNPDQIFGEICRRLEHLEKLTWLSPVPSERQSQEEKLRKIWPDYPNVAPDFQHLNGLLAIADEYFKLKQNDPPKD